MFDNADLERVDRHIAGAMRRNARLRREIAHRQFDGSDLTCATSLLEAFVIHERFGALSPRSYAWRRLNTAIRTASSSAEADSNLHAGRSPSKDVA
jgi:hypothetical protein